MEIFLYDLNGWPKPKLVHQLVVKGITDPWKLSDLLVDEEGRYWIRMRFGSGQDFKLIEPWGITTKPITTS